MKDKVVIIGAGGHGKVVAETILQSGNYLLSGFVDDHLATGTAVLDEYRVIANRAQLEFTDFDFFVVAIGNNMLRREIYCSLHKDHEPLTLIHPFTQVSPHAVIGKGTVVLPGAVISYGTVIGENCIIGSNVHIDHESVIGSHCHIRNGSSIGSNCIIDDLCSTETGFPLPSFAHLTTE